MENRENREIFYNEQENFFIWNSCGQPTFWILETDNILRWSSLGILGTVDYRWDDCWEFWNDGETCGWRDGENAILCFSMFFRFYAIAPSLAGLSKLLKFCPKVMQPVQQTDQNLKW